jgi:hypothetical protein
MWSANWPKRGEKPQYNHIWSNQKGEPLEAHVQRYTALWNIVVTPAFVAKLTDKSDQVKRALRRHAQLLYDDIPNDPHDAIDDTDLPDGRANATTNMCL